MSPLGKETLDFDGTPVEIAKPRERRISEQYDVNFIENLRAKALQQNKNKI